MVATVNSCLGHLDHSTSQNAPDNVAAMLHQQAMPESVLHRPTCCSVEVLMTRSQDVPLLLSDRTMACPLDWCRATRQGVSSWPAGTTPVTVSSSQQDCQVSNLLLCTECCWGP